MLKILIEKQKRRLTVTDGEGNDIFSFPIALGVHPVGPKEKEGDGEISYKDGGAYVHNLCASTAFGKYIKDGKEDSTLKTLLTGDPKFKDYENGDFRLAPGSPCINNAYGEATTKTDLAGKKRVIGKAMDIGCYEFSSGFSVVVR